jgi:hypothetical protein
VFNSAHDQSLAATVERSIRALAYNLVMDQDAARHRARGQ